jgi:hypothetical protein
MTTFEDTLNNAIVTQKKDALAGMKFDKDKLEYGLYPHIALQETVRVLTFGAKKYARDNWRYVDDADRRYFDAAMRHLWAWKAGETDDPETQMNHLAHAACCIAFLLHLQLDETKGT